MFLSCVIYINVKYRVIFSSSSILRLRICLVQWSFRKETIYHWETQVETVRHYLEKLNMTGRFPDEKNVK